MNQIFAVASFCLSLCVPVVLCAQQNPGQDSKPKSPKVSAPKSSPATESKAKADSESQPPAETKPKTESSTKPQAKPKDKSKPAANPAPNPAPNPGAPMRPAPPKKTTGKPAKPKPTNKPPKKKPQQKPKIPGGPAVPALLSEKQLLALVNTLQSAAKDSEREAAFVTLKTVKAGPTPVLIRVTSGAQGYASKSRPQQLTYKLRCIELLRLWAPWAGKTGAQSLYNASWSARGEVRVAVLNALLAYDKHTASYMSAFSSALRSQDKKVRIAALTAFEQHPTRAHNYLWSLQDLLKDDDPKLAERTFQFLLKCGSRGQQILSQALRSSDQKLKVAALKFLAILEQRDSKVVVNLLLKTLYDPSPQFRVRVLKKLGALSTKYPTALIGLFRSINDTDFDVQTVARGLIEQYDPEGSRVEKVLLKTVHSEDQTLRSMALEAIRDLPCADQAVQSFAKLLETGHSVARRRSAQSLYTLASHATVVADKIAKKLYDDDAEVSRYCSWALARMGPVTTPILVKALQSQHFNARRAAASALAGLTEAEPEMIAIFAKTVWDKDPQVRYSSIRVLGRSGRGHDLATQTLVKILTAETKDLPVSLSQSELQNLQRSAIYSLELLGPDAKPAYEALKSCFLKPRSSLQSSATRSLAKLGETSIELFRSSATHKDRNTRRNAAIGLGLNEAANESDEKRLIQMLNDKDSMVRRSAIQSIGQIAFDPDNCMEPLRKALKDSNSSVASEAAKTLAIFGVDSHSATPALAACLDKTRPRAVRLEAAKALDAIGPKAQVAIPQLIAVLGEKDDELLKAVGLCLKKLARKHDSALQGLIDKLNSPSQALQKICLEATTQNNERSEAAIKPLADWLSLDDLTRQKQALKALKIFGVKAKAILPSVIRCLQSSDSEVRSLAIWTCERIDLQDQAVITAILKLGQDPMLPVQIAVAQALGQFKGENPEVDALLQTMSQQQGQLGEAATNSISQRSPRRQ